MSSSRVFIFPKLAWYVERYSGLDPQLVTNLNSDVSTGPIASTCIIKVSFCKEWKEIKPLAPLIVLKQKTPDESGWALTMDPFL